jgi:NAD(P)-dependent dehydrogenase (short-subunit alcohol dehydrogenase family)
MNLEGKVAIVTGAGRGIGFRIACRLQRQGASVVFNDREVPATVTHHIESTSTKSKGVCHQADISQEHEVERLIDHAVQEFGGLDILVNNAGVDPTASFFNVGEDLWDRVMNTNLKGAFFCAQRAAWKMCAAGQGRIINIGSVHGQATLPGYSVYCASKGAINALTRALALELAPHAITVNAVCPGAIEVEKFLDSPIYDPAALAKEIPAGRVGKPEDISGMVAFLCSDEAAWITGQVISVDGGTLSRLSLYVGRPVP